MRGFAVGVAFMPIKTAFNPSKEDDESNGFRTEFDIGYIAKPDHRIAVRRDDQLTESLGGIERSLGIDAGLNKIALDLPRRSGEIIGGQSDRDIKRRHAARGHPVRIEPNPHREGLAAKDLGIGDAINRLQSRLNHAVQIIRNL